MSTSRTVGVLGTLVWDRILTWPDGDTATEDWGGIAYSLAAMVASTPRSWAARPIVKVGSDLADVGRAFLGGLPRVEDRAVVTVPEPNNRVELRYETRDRRTERLTGGVPPWRADELLEATRGCDALFVNFISGFEMDLDTARRLRAHFPGPIYCDLHSLFLGIDPDGTRVPRRLPWAEEWVACFDAIQVNEDELELLCDPDGPRRGIEDVPGPHTALATVTLGRDGAAFAIRPGGAEGPLAWPAVRGQPVEGVARGGRVPLRGEPSAGDPTGCGDVWGAATFGRLLAGDAVEAALRHANRLAAASVEHTGASALYQRFLAETA